MSLQQSLQNAFRIGLALAALTVLSTAQTVCDARSGQPTQIQIQLSFDETSEDNGDGSAALDTASRSETAGGQRSRDYLTNTQIRVQLHDPLGGMLQESAPNAEGQVRMMVCRKLIYRLRVIGPEIEEAIVDRVEPNRGDKYVNITLHKKGDKKRKKSGRSLISASGLKVPRKAMKAYEKGNDILKNSDVVEAEKYFREALRIYPQFEDAENRLGLVLMVQGKKEEGKAAFERAIKINDHYAAALVNLAKVAVDARNFKEAYGFSQKALSTEPLNPGALFVAIESAYFSGNYQEAVAYTRTLHTLPHAKYGLAHFLAGKALQAQKQDSPALIEYQTFVEEDPTDPNALQARELMSYLEMLHVH
jgi:tetratricopeptide (TPR) repeat protein